MPEELVARQLWIEAPGRARIREAILAPPGPGQVLIRTRYSGISRGTESLVFRGRVPASQGAAMRAPFQEGDFPGPVKYGYLSVGEVVDVREGAGPVDGVGVSDGAIAAGGPGSLAGRTVFCLHPHQDLYVVPAGAVTPLPAGVPAERAILAGNMETALNAVWDGNPAPGQRITVVGAGVVGLSIAWLCGRIPGTQVTAVDVNPAREEAACALGVGFDGEIPSEAGSDLVFHASGTPEGLRDALRAASADGTVVEVSWFGDTPVELPLGEEFHSRRLTLRSSQVGAVPPSHRSRWSRKERRELAVGLLRDSRLDVLITGESPFEELPGVLHDLSRDPGDALCHRIRYSDQRRDHGGHPPGSQRDEIP
ncbi:MAG: zinc-dependent alcohol dehydrogenase [Gemmatimonadota bacterium]